MSSTTPPRRISLSRTYNATLHQVWTMWTTPAGIEAWWGPEGFSVGVRNLDLRPGGALFYTMTATAAPQVAFMKQHGACRLFFVPGVPTYSVATQVDLRQVEAGVELTLTFDAMHDETWTGRATEGWTSELGKLDAALTRAGISASA